MFDTLEIGASPCEEECAQVGSDDYAEKARRECRAFINLLIRSFGEPPEGCSLRIKSNPHDYGTYYEVACRFDSNDRPSVDYAYRCEGETPATWDEQALAELGLPSRVPPPPPELWEPGQGQCVTLDGPEDETETSIRWGRWTDDKAGRWYLPQYMSGSDYSGTLVERSNVRAWQEAFPDGQGVWWKDVFGGHSTFGIVVDRAFLATAVKDISVESVAREACEFLDALDGYPLADESLHSEMEMEAQNEAWKDWARRDFARELQKRLETLWSEREEEKRADAARLGTYPLADAPAPSPEEDSVPDISELDLAELFYKTSESVGEYWVNEEGETMWIDVEKVAENVTDSEILELAS